MNCKPGQRAITVSGGNRFLAPEHLGQLVEVGELNEIPACHITCALQAAFLLAKYGNIWTCTALTSFGGEAEIGEEVFLPDANLRPLVDIKEDEQIHEGVTA